MIIVVTKTKTMLGKSRYDVKVISADEDSAKSIDREILNLDDAVKKIKRLQRAHVVSYCDEIKSRTARVDENMAGKRTRIIDSAVQALFNYGELDFDAFYASKDAGRNITEKTSIQFAPLLFGKLVKRLKNEHNYKFGKMSVDFDNRKISINSFTGENNRK
jgi:hypothetical protein